MALAFYESIEVFSFTLVLAGLLLTLLAFLSLLGRIDAHRLLSSAGLIVKFLIPGVIF